MLTYLEGERRPRSPFHFSRRESDALNPKIEIGRSDRSGDAASPKGECAAPGAFFPAAKGGRLSNRRRGVAITFCDEGVAATSKPISVFGLN
jgi:hypothetical protein